VNINKHELKVHCCWSLYAVDGAIIESLVTKSLEEEMRSQAGSMQADPMLNSTSDAGPVNGCCGI
jgi:hypothetical protein